jgi:hypothetical protein
MYGVFGLLVARPLFGVTPGAKLAGAGLGLYVLLYHGLFIGVMSGSMPTAVVGPYA